MKCENLKAYLDGELGPISRRLMRAHVRSCDACRRNAEEWARLSRQIDGLEGEPVPQALRERVMADAMTAAALAQAQKSSPASPRPRTQGRIKMKRALIVGAFVAVLLLAGFWFLPHNGHEVALADVARAMQNVQSAHFVGEASGLPIECWVKAPSKFRLQEDGKYFQNIADDGDKLVSIQPENGVMTATIQPSGQYMYIEAMPYWDFFRGEEGVNSVLRKLGLKVVSIEKTTLADGRSANVFVLDSPTQKVLMSFDANTNLLQRLESYDKHSGVIQQKIEKAEYNVEVPDSVFHMAIPKKAFVMDFLTPPAPEVVEKRERMAKQLEAEGGNNIGDFPRGSCGSPYHKGIRFKSISAAGIKVYYLPKRNVYYVLGKALIYHSDSDQGPSEVVEDSEVKAPAGPVLEYKPKPIISPKREAMVEKLKSAGGKVIWTMGKGNAGTPYHKGLTFYTVGDDGVVLIYMPDRNSYYVIGKAKAVYLEARKGFEKVIKDAELPAPGPPDKQPE